MYDVPDVADRVGQIFGEGVAREGPGRENHRMVFGRGRDGLDDFVNQANPRVRNESTRDLVGKDITIDGERSSCRDLCDLRCAKDE